MTVRKFYKTKPCFCGSKKKPKEVQKDYGNKIICPGCGYYSDELKYKYQAAFDWNTRQFGLDFVSTTGIEEEKLLIFKSIFPSIKDKEITKPNDFSDFAKVCHRLVNKPVNRESIFNTDNLLIKCWCKGKQNPKLDKSVKGYRYECQDCGYETKRFSSKIEAINTWFDQVLLITNSEPQKLFPFLNNWHKDIAQEIEFLRFNYSLKAFDNAKKTLNTIPCLCGTDQEPLYKVSKRGVRLECPACGFETYRFLKLETSTLYWNIINEKEQCQSPNYIDEVIDHHDKLHDLAEDLSALGRKSSSMELIDVANTLKATCDPLYNYYLALESEERGASDV